MSGERDDQLDQEINRFLDEIPLTVEEAMSDPKNKDKYIGCRAWRTNDGRADSNVIIVSVDLDEVRDALLADPYRKPGDRFEVWSLPERENGLLRSGYYYENLDPNEKIIIPEHTI